MKRILFIFVICFLSFLSEINAECTYADVVELNTLASHVNYNYEFNESSQSFDLTFNNLANQLKFEYLNETLEPADNKIVISNVKEGSKLTIRVFSSQNSECVNEFLRVISISLPYQNEFYNTYYCEGYANLPICSTRFLEYEMSYEVFEAILNKQIEQETKEEEPEDKDETDKEETIIDFILRFLKNHWVEGSIIIGSSVITFVIGNVIYRKKKYKI
jgi:hypothetical protein